MVAIQNIIKIKAGTKFDPLLSKNNDLNLKHII